MQIALPRLFSEAILEVTLDNERVNLGEGSCAGRRFAGLRKRGGVQKSMSHIDLPFLGVLIFLGRW